MGNHERLIEDDTLVTVPSGQSYDGNRFPKARYVVHDFDPSDNTYWLEEDDGRSIVNRRQWAYAVDIQVLYASDPDKFTVGETVEHDGEVVTVIHQDGEWLWVRAEFGVSGQLAHKSRVEQVVSFKVGSTYALKSDPVMAYQFKVTGIDLDGYATALYIVSKSRTLVAPEAFTKYKEI